MQKKLFFFLLLSMQLMAEDLKPDPRESFQRLSIEETDCKKAIQLQTKKIDTLNDKEKSEALYQLSLLYLKDQDLEFSFKKFLEALEFALKEKENTSQTSTCTTKTYDLSIYEKAFTIYINPTSPSPEETANSLLNLLNPYLKEHSHETLLEFYVAIAYANLKNYEEFLKHFYRAYKCYPEHYLSYRTKAILYAKILEREGVEENRSELRQLVLHNLKLSLNYEPRDTTIYKLIITFAEKKSKGKEINQCLNKIIKANIIIPRTDLLFYVHAAVSANQLEEAKSFVEAAKKWYPKSRLVDAAEQYLNGHKGATCNE